jgi:hypothetical protein
MQSTGVNYLAILVGGFVYFALGAIWYARPVFGNIWMKGIGKSEEQVKADYSILKLVWALIGSLIAAYGVARILSWTGPATATNGFLVGLMAGVCFVFAIMTMNDFMESRPRKLTEINILYHMIGLAAAGIIIGAWG